MTRDPLFKEAKKLVTSTGRPTTSFLQTRLAIGYPRAARLMFQLQNAGHVLPVERHPSAIKDDVHDPTGAKLKRPVQFSPEHLAFLQGLARDIQKKVGGRIDISKPLAVMIDYFMKGKKKA